MGHHIVFGTDKIETFYVRDLTDFENIIHWDYKHNEQIGNIAFMIMNNQSNRIGIVSSSCKI